MRHEELRETILARWVAPISDAEALAVANEVLSDLPKERLQFGDWFEKNGALVLERINGARV